MKILVIEDDRDIEELLQFFLEDNGYQVAIARDGLEGIMRKIRGKGLIVGQTTILQNHFPCLCCCEK